MNKDERAKLIRDAQQFLANPDRREPVPEVPTTEPELMAERARLTLWLTACRSNDSQYHKSDPQTLTVLVESRLERVNEGLGSFEAARQREAQQRAFDQDGRGVFWARWSFIATVGLGVPTLVFTIWDHFKK